MDFVNDLATSLHVFDIQLSAAVQAMFGIQDVPYQPNCTPAWECSQACDKLPSAYPLEPRVPQMMADSKIDRWLVMDTYYFSTGRFLNALDWYAMQVGQPKTVWTPQPRQNVFQRCKNGRN